MSKNLKGFFNRLTLILAAVFSASICKCESFTLSGLTCLESDSMYWSQGINCFLEGNIACALDCFSLAQSSLQSSGRRWGYDTIVCDPQQLGVILLDQAFCLTYTGDFSRSLEKLLFISNKVPFRKLGSAATKQMLKLKKSPTSSVRQLRWWGSPESQNIKSCIRAYSDNMTKVFLTKDKLIIAPSSVDGSKIKTDLEKLYLCMFSAKNNVKASSQTTFGNIVIIDLENGEFDKLRKVLNEKATEYDIDLVLKHPLNKKPKIVSALEKILTLQKELSPLEAAFSTDKLIEDVTIATDFVGNHEDVQLLLREVLAALARVNEKVDLKNKELDTLKYISVNSVEVFNLTFNQPHIHQKAKQILNSENISLSSNDKSRMVSLSQNDPFGATIIEMGDSSVIFSPDNGWGLRAIPYIIKGCKLGGIDKSLICLTPSLNIMIKGNKETATNVVSLTKSVLESAMEEADKESSLHSELLALWSIFS